VEVLGSRVQAGLLVLGREKRLFLLDHRLQARISEVPPDSIAAKCLGCRSSSGVPSIGDMVHSPADGGGRK
jgi:hypothetical protein